MSSAPRFVPRYTIDDYRRWEGDWELIDGVAIAMSPSPLGPHERIVSRLSYQLQTQFDRNKCKCEVYTNLDWIVSRDTVIRPDLMVVCGDQPERHLERPPALMVEVLSQSTRDSDLTAKRDIAREQGVLHYWIISADDRSITEASGEVSVAIDPDRNWLVEFDKGCSAEILGSRLFDS